MNSLYVYHRHVEELKLPGLSVSILAGGESRRFGADKAKVQLCPDGRTLLERVADTGRQIADDVFVVGHARYASVVPRLRIVPDNHSGAGPLAGIQTAFQSSSASHLLVLACDMPCLSLDLLKWMVASTNGSDVSMPRTRDGRWHPMPAIYARTALPGIRTCLDTGHSSVISLLDRVTVQEFTEAELRRFDPNLDSLFSLNRPDQMNHAMHCASCN